MRKNDIAVGMKCWTKISGDRVEVEVVSDSGERGRRFVVKRVDNGKVLGARRAGTALHPSKYGTAPGAFTRSVPTCHCNGSKLHTPAGHYHEPPICPPSPKPRSWVFTFGSGHTHPTTGESLERRFVRIGGTAEEAREIMVTRFGQKWSHQYATDDEAGIAQFGLLELELADNG